MTKKPDNEFMNVVRIDGTEEFAKETTPSTASIQETYEILSDKDTENKNTQHNNI
ncbi:hypothetical protein ACERII_21245 [Evansella sp. AB-rgal1]|uniref:hypothetical protein n=1 Tax=Evansella sp. AB-rgal1 TaxID=3242696 RepID=UPI00359E6E28